MSNVRLWNKREFCEDPHYWEAVYTNHTGAKLQLLERQHATGTCAVCQSTGLDRPPWKTYEYYVCHKCPEPTLCVKCAIQHACPGNETRNFLGRDAPEALILKWLCRLVTKTPEKNCLVGFAEVDPNDTQWYPWADIIYPDRGPRLWHPLMHRMSEMPQCMFIIETKASEEGARPEFYVKKVIEEGTGCADEGMER